MKKLIILALMVGSSLLAGAFQYQCSDSLVPEWEPCGNQQCIQWYIETTCEDYFIDYSTIPAKKVVTSSTTTRRPAIGLE